MKMTELIIKLAVAAAAIVGIAYLIVRYMDAIKAWAQKLCPMCAEEIVEEDEAAAEDAPADEVVEEVVAEEAPADAPVDVPADAPVADAADFEA